MSTITEAIPSLFGGIFSEQNSVANPSVEQSHDLAYLSSSPHTELRSAPIRKLIPVTWSQRIVSSWYCKRAQSIPCRKNLLLPDPKSNYENGIVKPTVCRDQP